MTLRGGEIVSRWPHKPKFQVQFLAAQPFVFKGFL